MELTDKQRDILTADGHLLVTGGPGSGKTTIAILKAAKIAEHTLRLGQKILFVSFARATVSRVIEAIEYEQRVPHEQKKRIDVETYHSFFWRILKTHGYLIGLPRRLSILTPPKEAIALSAVRIGWGADSKLNDAAKVQKLEDLNAERLRLARMGSVCFDLFARYTGDILEGSTRIRKLVAAMYPVIILDEFQDTNSEQWRVVKALGHYSRLIALADPAQRIYGWLGADPERLNHFKESCEPTEVDLGGNNHRSGGTDIAAFGNDILKGEFRNEPYRGIEICLYKPNENEAYTKLIATIYRARKRLIDGGRKPWSLAVLVPTKRMTRLVSDKLRLPPAGMKEIPHTAAIEMEAAILGAEIIAFLMQPDTDGRHFERVIELLRDYFHGKGGDTPTKKDLKEAANIQKAYDKWLYWQAEKKAIGKNNLLINLRAVYDRARALKHTGDPQHDWRTMRKILEEGPCIRLKGLAQEVRNVRLLNRGAQLRQQLSQNWRDSGAYSNALAIVKQAFVQEHLSTNAKPEAGVVVMNMHKAKGKQFDEVIIFEGWPRVAKGEIIANFDRIVRSNVPANADDQARQNLHVSITRAKIQTTILTPKNDPCVLLVPRKDL